MNSRVGRSIFTFVKKPAREEIRRAVQYTFLNLGTPIAFYGAFYEWGAKAAIGFAVVITLFQLLVHRFYQIRLSPIFIVASGFTTLFGVIDLTLQSPRFFRLEPFAQNFLIGTALFVSLTARIPVAAWFISGLPTRIRPNLTHESQSYLKKLTLIWGIYLYIKAIIFLYLAFQVNLADLVVLRTLIGGGTLFLMFLVEFVYRKWFRKVH
jgi:intracellular septation protein A